MIVFIGLSVIHILVFSWLHYHWVRIPEISEEHNKSTKKFSVIVPVRNEVENIATLLRSIDQQDFPKDQFEVIVIDDHSEDETEQVVKDTSETLSYRLIYIRAGKKKGKKPAIMLGVNEAAHEYIITTDGDCSPGPKWISSYASAYEEAEVVMLTGPVQMIGSTLFSRFQSLEFASLIGFGAATLHSNNPSMCNGANMSYKKSVFLEVGGYKGNEQIPSGDDEFLLQKIHELCPRGISFLKDKRAVVGTPTKASFGALVNQRMRWSSKWQYHKSWFIRGSAVLVFADYIMLIISACFSLMNLGSLPIFGGVFVLRWIFDMRYMRSVGSFFGIRKSSINILSFYLQIIYPVFVSLLGLASIFGKYSWKGRKY